MLQALIVVTQIGWRSNKDFAANKVCSDSSAEHLSELAYQVGHDTVEIDSFADTDPGCQAKITELDLIPPSSEWKDVFYQVNDDFDPGICTKAKSGIL